MKWEQVYKKAIADDGSLLFPERLTHEFLESAKRIMGSYKFANQYQNEIIPESAKPFKDAWIKYYSNLPGNVYRFAFVDPAISQSANADYTGAVVIAVDQNQSWYVEYAQRHRATPTELLNLLFKIQEQFNCQSIAVESVAYQEAILYMLAEEMRHRNKIIPVTGLKRSTDKSKETRILALVPRFEWNRIFLKQGLYDLEMELAQFPRAAHDDLIDALASLEEIVYYPGGSTTQNKEPNPNDPSYESWYIKQLVKRSNQPDHD